MRASIKSGDKFGKLVVIKQNGIHKKPCGTTERKWLCKCECGNFITVLGHNLKTGNTKSCGCLPKQMNRLPDNKGVINHIILQYKRHARDRGISWNLSYEKVRSIIQKPCFYCGAEKSDHTVTKNCKEGYDHNGIDRVDSSKGYSAENVVPCCKICNRGKANMSKEDFIELACRIAKHSQAMSEQWG